MTIYEKLSKIQTKFKSKKSRFNSFGKTKNYLKFRQSLNRKKVDLTHSVNITSGQPKTFSKQQNPFC